MEESATPTESQTIWFSHAKNFPATFSQIYQLITKNIPEVSLKTQSAREDLDQAVQNNQRGILIFSVSDREELANILSFLPTAKPSIRDRRALVIVFLKTYSDKIEEALLKAGCYEVLRFDTSPKAFLYKIKRYLMHIRNGVAPDASEFEMNAEKSTKADAGATGDSKKVRAVPNQERSQDSRVRAQRSPVYQKKSSAVLLIDALPVTQDFWLFRKRVYAKKHKTKWLIEIIGPSIAAGKWILAKDFDDVFPGHPQVWRWSIRENSKFGNQFSGQPGAWFFTGNQPEYSWVQNRWGFVSEKPMLAYVDEKRSIASRFELNAEGELRVAHNSDFATAHFEKIRDTFDQDYYLEMERLASGNVRLSMDEPSDIPWADRSNSRDIEKNDWNHGDLSNEVTYDIGLGDLSATPEKSWGHSLEESMPDLDIPLGADAMKSCGVHAFCKDSEIELIGYSEAEQSVMVGVTNGTLRTNEFITLTIRSENLSEPLMFELSGIVRSAESDDTRTIAQIAVQIESQSKIVKIREAIEVRQEQIFQFFNRVKGY
jgi:hypothetical protein